MTRAGEVQYLVVPDPENPYLLARVRWPDVFQAISPVRPDWQDDPGLFDLPYSSSSTAVTLDRAAAIAAEWGGYLPSEEDSETPRLALMRRMPADWSNLSRAERRAWSIEDLKRAKPVLGDVERADDEDAAPKATRRRWRRRTPDGPRTAGVVPIPLPDVNGAIVGNGNGHVPDIEREFIDLTDVVIDVTDVRDDVAVTAEDS
jgi:hypothetical protein